jgi:DNA (cytosine-5)-methyltransferase 1
MIFYGYYKNPGTKRMSKPKLLDLFAGAGGAAMGYLRAGFDPYGIDNDPKPLRHYPFPYICMDALGAMDKLLRGEGLTFSNGETLYLTDITAFHASPPCQKWSNMTKRWARQNDHPDLIGPSRERLKLFSKPYVIENIEGAPLLSPVMLCGTMFGLCSGNYNLRRHRIFECSFGVPSAPASCNHAGLALPVYGHAGGRSKRDGLKFPGTAAWREGMRIEWMIGNELAEAIPPTYTEYIGKYLMMDVLKYEPSTFPSYSKTG